MERVISEIITKLFDQDVSVQLTRPDPKFGDFATNAALQLAKPLGKNPREIAEAIDRKSTRLNSSHASISYAVFCLKKKIAINKLLVL